jgi:hemerythrin
MIQPETPKSGKIWSDQPHGPGYGGVSVKLFKWTNHYSVYIPEIDDEHRSLFRMAAELQREIVTGATPDRVQTMLHEIINQITAHFAHEERLMIATHCFYYRWHKKQHDTAARRVRSLERRIRGGDGDAALELLHFLADWLQGHIGLTDRMMSAHLRAYERRIAAFAS